MLTELLFKIAAIALLLGGLVFVHELGHFIAAKALGVKVVRFSLGFGPRLFGFSWGETEYQWALLPLGGYVKMAGDEPGAELASEDRGRGFLEQAPWRRFIIGVAGPAMNLALPVAIYFAMLLGQNGALVPGPRVGSLAPDSPAERAGLQPGDRILSVTAPGRAPAPIRFFSDMREHVAPFPGVPLRFEVERDGHRLPPITIAPAPEQESNEIETSVRGVIGVTPAYTAAVVAPIAPGAAGAVEPFDLVIRAAGQPVAHAGDLRRALARCAPVDLEVLRELPVAAPGAVLSTARHLSLAAVPSCRDGRPTLILADPGLSTVIAAVEPGSPADRAGLKRGDVIAVLNGKAVRSFRDLNLRSAEFKVGQPVTLALADGRRATLIPTAKRVVDRASREVKYVPELGFHPDQRTWVDFSTLLVERIPFRIGVLDAARVAVENVKEAVRLTVLALVRVATGRLSFKTVGGPIMLFDIASRAAAEGLESYLFTMAIISVNLGLMNLLPIPVLDGGHMMAALLETVTRRRLSVRAREIANLVGIVLLVLLMLVAFKNDIVRVLEMG